MVDRTTSLRGHLTLRVLAVTRSFDSSALRRLAQRACFVVIVESFLFEAIAILRGSRVWLVHQLPDDAFYYFEIGRRIAAGQGSTFDGVTRTDGFHPLWEALIAGTATVWHGDDLIRAALLLSVLLSLVSVLILIRATACAIGSGPAFFGALVVVHSPRTFNQLVNGMESSVLVACLATLILAYAYADDRRNVFSAVMLGLSSGLVVLARLDFALVIPLVGLALLLRTHSLRLVVAWGIGTALISGTFFAWNVVSFHHLNTVSGTLKLTYANGYVMQAFGGRATAGYLWFTLHTAVNAMKTVQEDTFHNIFAIWSGLGMTILRNGVSILAAVGVVVLIVRRRLSDGVTPALRPSQCALLLGCALVGTKAIFDVTLLPLYVTSWYSAPERVALGFAGGAFAWYFLVLFQSRLRLLGHIGMVFLVFLSLPISWYVVADASSATWSRTAWQDVSLRAAGWVTAHGPTGRYGSTDAGLLGYYVDGPQRTVINLDGLANDFWYAQYALGKKSNWLEAYRHMKLRYFMGRVEPGSSRLPKCAQSVWLYPFKVPYGTGSPGDPVIKLDYGVWDLRPCYPR